MSATACIHPTKAGHTLTSERLDVPDWGSGGGGGEGGGRRESKGEAGGRKRREEDRRGEYTVRGDRCSTVVFKILGF